MMIDGYYTKLLKCISIGHLNIVFKYRSQCEEYEKNKNDCIIIKYIMLKPKMQRRVL